MATWPRRGQRSNGSGWSKSELAVAAALAPAKVVVAAGEFSGSGGGVSAPMVLVKVDPEYSEEARKAKYSGTDLALRHRRYGGPRPRNPGGEVAWHGP